MKVGFIGLGGMGMGMASNLAIDFQINNFRLELLKNHTAIAKSSRSFFITQSVLLASCI